MRAIQKLKQVGFDIWLEGEKIRYKQRSKNPVDEVWVNNLLHNIKEHKQETIRYLRQGTKPTPKQDPTEPVADSVYNSLTLDPDFTKAGLIVKFYSDLLNEDFYLCSTPQLRDLARKHDQGIVAYLPEEVERLAGLRPEEVKRLHMVKKAFPGGEFISSGNAEDSIFNREIG